MRLFRPGFLVSLLFPEALFRLSTSERLLCLTFDDGPDPESTPSLLDLLALHQIKAIFFCDGRAAEKFPDLLTRIKEEGHIVGNHGYSHLNGWGTSHRNYIEDIRRASQFTSSKLFRPPFGKIKHNQYSTLKESMRIVFWDIMPYDFDPGYGTKKSLKILKRKIRPGSIIVLHDNARSTSLEFIEDFILFARHKGFRFVNSII